MRDGFIKVAAATPKMRVADISFNTDKIIETIKESVDYGAKIVVFPKLAVTGATCGDLFFQDSLIKESFAALFRISEETKNLDVISFVGLPIVKNQRLYSVFAVINCGGVIGFVPETNLTAADKRFFAKWSDVTDLIAYGDNMVPLGTKLLFECDGMENLLIGCELGGDTWAVNTPSTGHCLAGATMITCGGAMPETVVSADNKRRRISDTSSRLSCAYVYAESGSGESTTDFVYAGQNVIAEAGDVLGETRRFRDDVLLCDVDVDKIAANRRIEGFETDAEAEYMVIPFVLKNEETKLTRRFERNPFVPSCMITARKRAEQILNIQTAGLKKRLEHIHCPKVVIGVSGGLDSTLALLVCAKTMDSMKESRENIVAITMPCFGTTNRTKSNAIRLSEVLGCKVIEIPIANAVSVHLNDIGHPEYITDVTYENAQARERTQVLMDYANQIGAIVVGTGDLSELALGWATYNGDHMSMYDVNASVPKTMLRLLVSQYAQTCGNDEIRTILTDVLNTPVSPELLPPTDGEIAQKTENIVGPYELHDFFLFYMLRYGFSPSKIFRLAVKTFESVYDEETIKNWMKIFYRRFFAQQFKRSCLTDGPCVGSVGISPRGGLSMPSDACGTLWLSEIEKM